MKLPAGASKWSVWSQDSILSIGSKGSLLSTAELVEAATGRPLGTASFERHLRNRYLG